MIAAALFRPIVFSCYWQLSRAEGSRGHLKMRNIIFGKPGYLRRLPPEFLDYAQYSVHPGSRTTLSCEPSWRN